MILTQKHTFYLELVRSLLRLLAAACVGIMGAAQSKDVKVVLPQDGSRLFALLEVSFVCTACVWPA